ncbi:MAG TPA: tetratricopeptide repeat protein [Bryobacteraceae bacterium]|nr:tetratricopeptide repeat protein [Bryobacteraceae bacterium]
MKRIVIGMLAVALAAVAQKNDQGERLLKAAMNAELVNGDLKAAIEQYKTIASKYASDHTVAAQALIHMAECHQKMGDTEARKVYEQVVREYADQKEAVALARAKLGKAPGAVNSGMFSREVWSLPEMREACSMVSRDGRYLPYIDWSEHGDLFLHDFSSDTNRRLTNTGTDHVLGPKVEQFADDVVSFSRDGKQLAYSWLRGDINRYELRLMDLRGDGIPPSRLLFDNPDIQYLAPTDWSPDGKLIAVKIQRADKTGQIGLVSVTDGALRVLKSVDWRGPTRLGFSGDGKYLAYDRPPADNTEQRNVFLLATDGSREIPAAASPSQDTVVGWSNDGKRLLFTSDRSGSAGLWSVLFADGKIAGSPELLKPDIGQILGLGVTDAGKLYAVVNPIPSGTSDVYVATIDFAAGKLLSPPALAAQTYVGNNKSPAWSPDGKNLAFASWRNSAGPGHFVIGIRSMETGLVREVSPSPGFDALSALTWVPDGSAWVVRGGDTKGRYGIFRVDAKTGQSSILVTQGERETIGPLGISPDGKKLYYSSNHFEARYALESQNSFIMEKDLATATEKELLRTQNAGYGPLLSPDGQYIMVITERYGPSPAVSIVPTAGGELRKLAEAIGIAQGWAADSSAIYDIRKSGELWRLPVDGSKPQKLNLKWQGNNPMGPFRVHPDGRQIAIGTPAARNGTQVWVLENFLPAVKGTN